MVHLVSDCTHLTRCPKLVVRITLKTPSFMYIHTLKSGVVSKRLLNETTWSNQRRKKRTHNTKKPVWKTNLTMRTFNKVTETT
ncbi:hypothetical protein CGI37_22920 [Vibrio parahaemolyticus]|nr:hypothetical protein CGI44_12990 [Vibrio parahaemolyticus]TOJ51822.1 hypothetical protein CGI37_22920 [Vibrio parahaemolyticus]